MKKKRIKWEKIPIKWNNFFNKFIDSTIKLKYFTFEIFDALKKK